MIVRRSMRILGIDPGSRHTGYGLVEAEGQRLRAVTFGRISCPPKETIPHRLAQLARETRRLVTDLGPDVAVLETPYHGLNSRSLVVLAQARGALLSVLAESGVEIAEYSPAEIKSAVAGTGRADKVQVERMVRLQLALGANVDLSSDASDALAMAICFAHRGEHDRFVARLNRE